MAAMSEQEVPNPYRHCLKMAISFLCTEVGFESAEMSCLETMSELVTSLLVELGRGTRAYCELACRVEPVVADLVLALIEMGLPIDGLRDYAARSSHLSLNPPVQAVAAKQTAILHTGNKRRQPTHIPDHMPEMPDSHSYIRTPTHRQPVTDYESVREKAASQKRDVERALTRFIAKTGKIHNLFNSDDSNLFPLISCVREEEGVNGAGANGGSSASGSGAGASAGSGGGGGASGGSFKLPAYVDALVFKDQVFEEDEIERRPKKRKPNQQSDENDDDDEDERTKLNESLAESEVIDNAFLRPVRMPRTPKKS